jgi:putative transcriptional regulator
MLQKLRSGQLVSWATIDMICDLLDCQPGDLIEFTREATVQEMDE